VADCGPGGPGLQSLGRARRLATCSDMSAEDTAFARGSTCLHRHGITHEALQRLENNVLPLVLHFTPTTSENPLGLDESHG